MLCCFILKVDSILSSPPPKSYFARRFDRVMSTEDLDGSSGQGSFLAENTSVTVNPLVGENLLIDLGSPTRSQSSSTKNLVS